MSEKDVRAAFGRNKFEVIRVETNPRRHVYSIRVPSDPAAQARWRTTMNDFILGTSEARAKKSSAAQKYSWHADVSKWFFEQGGVVKFCWRIMILAESPDGVSRGENMLAQCATNALREGIEITSMPLVGRKNYQGKNVGGVYSIREGAAKAAEIIGSGR